MNAREIKRAVDEGLDVYWSSRDYRVWKDKTSDEYFISSSTTSHTIGLTWKDGVTLNGKEEEFFVVSKAES